VAADLLGDEGPFDLIVANLPYVSGRDWLQLEPEVRLWEPQESLIAGPEGTECNERLLSVAPGRLAPSGVLAAEFGAGQTAGLRQAAGRSFPGAEILVRTDLAGIDRVIVIKT
jgi:release factor glutamine methyltransferase